MNRENSGMLAGDKFFLMFRKIVGPIWPREELIVILILENEDKEILGNLKD